MRQIRRHFAIVSVFVEFRVSSVGGSRELTPRRGSSICAANAVQHWIINLGRIELGWRVTTS